MLKNIYTPLSGAITQERLLEVIANNLANANTTGFKSKKISFSLIEAAPDKNYPEPIPPANYKQDISHLYPLIGNDMAYTGVTAEIQRDLSQGPAINTHNPTDVMLEGPGMFTVQTPNGVRYSRSGAFTMNRDGVLVTPQGHPVLGERGNIMVRHGAFEINHRGEIYQDGELIDRLSLAEFSDQTSLEQVGHNYFYYGGPEEGMRSAEATSVRQGFLEGSNVNPMKNLTAMIMAHRSYEAYQKAVSNFDKMMEQSSNTIGSIRA